MRFLNLRIQTKLMLAIIASVIFVSGLVYSVSEKKIKDTWKRAVESHVSEEVNRYYNVRKSRLEGSIRHLERIAEIKEVAAIFESGDFSKEALTEIRNTLGKGPRGTKGPSDTDQNRREPGPSGPSQDSIIGLVLPTGTFHPVVGGEVRRSTSKDDFRILETVENVDTPQIGHFPMDFSDGSHELFEITLAPVSNSQGEFAGAVLQGRAMPNGPTQAQAQAGERERSFQMFNHSLVTAIFVEGELFGPGPIVEGTKFELVKLLSDPTTDFRNEVLVWSDEQPFRVFVKQLNETSALPASYQVVLYPMERLFSELKDLRLKGSGIGAAALFIGLLLSWWTARSFGKPISDLALATEEVRKGNFKTRVVVRSKDELGELAASFNDMMGELAQKERYREVLGKVSDETVAQALIEGNFELGGELREVSILFCDVRGFSGITEHMPPDQLITFINQHMTAMTQLVHEHNGVVDKFIGDEIMAIFGAPKSYGDDAANAAKCAIAMIERRRELNETSEIPCEIGIGVSTGNVVVGCMGSIDRLNYTVLGERVNRGARLASLAKPGQILVDETTVAEVGPGLQSNSLDNITLKGYSESTKAFDVIGFSSTEENSVSPEPAKQTV